jgi:hypothetical protein
MVHIIIFLDLKTYRFEEAYSSITIFQVFITFLKNIKMRNTKILKPTAFLLLIAFVASSCGSNKSPSPSSSSRQKTNNTVDEPNLKAQEVNTQPLHNGKVENPDNQQDADIPKHNVEGDKNIPEDSQPDLNQTEPVDKAATKENKKTKLKTNLLTKPKAIMGALQNRFSRKNKSVSEENAKSVSTNNTKSKKEVIKAQHEATDMALTKGKTIGDQQLLFSAATVKAGENVQGKTDQSDANSLKKKGERSIFKFSNFRKSNKANKESNTAPNEKMALTKQQDQNSHEANPDHSNPMDKEANHKQTIAQVANGKEKLPLNQESAESTTKEEATNLNTDEPVEISKAANVEKEPEMQDKMDQNNAKSLKKARQKLMGMFGSKNKHKANEKAPIQPNEEIDLDELNYMKNTRANSDSSNEIDKDAIHPTEKQEVIDKKKSLFRKLLPKKERTTLGKNKKIN